MRESHVRQQIPHLRFSVILGILIVLLSKCVLFHQSLGLLVHDVPVGRLAFARLMERACVGFVNEMVIQQLDGRQGHE